MSLFTCTVRNLADWAKIYSRIEPFEALIRHILAFHGFPQTELTQTIPGSHAVIRAGEVIVKIFAPDTVGWNCEADYDTEIFTMQRAADLGVHVPKLYAYGKIMDKYCFRYLVMECIRGTEFSKASLTDEEKYAVGREIRAICDCLNTPCENWNGTDIFADAQADEKWSEFPLSFQKERLAYLSSHPFSPSVYVHADIHGDNVILTPSGEAVLLDFADSVTAPVSYEYAALIPGLFQFEKPYLDGFFGEGWISSAVAEILTEGLLLHRFGVNILKDNGINPGTIETLKELKYRITGLLPT